MIDLTKPHTLTNDDLAELAALTDATKSDLVGELQRHTDYLRSIASVLGLSSVKAEAMATKIVPTPYRLMDD